MNIEKAIKVALEAHANTKDKAGKPYILHPLRVMLKLESDDEMMVGVLHDVLEDTEITVHDLRDMGFSETVIEGVLGVTKLESEIGESPELYEKFIERCSENPLARRVKIADLQDNSDLSRLENPSEKDFARKAKYSKALEFLEKC